MFTVEHENNGLRLTNEALCVILTHIEDNGRGRWANMEVFEKESGAGLIPERRLDLLDPRAQSQLLAALTVANGQHDWDGLLTAITQVLRNVGAGNTHPDSPDSVEWGDPVPFHEITVHPFPTEVLPGSLRRYVEALSEATQTPPDLPALLSLAVCASAVSRKVEIRVRPGYIEPLNVFVAVVLPPGSRKSSVFTTILSPIQQFERAENERLGPEIATVESEYRVAEKALTHTQTRAAKETDAAKREKLREQAVEMAQELAKMTRLYPPRLVADDITPERAASLLYEQRGRMAIMSPEGGEVFDMMAGRYSGNRRPNFGVFLKGHAGDTLRVDRVGRQPEHVERPALTLGLAVQPEALHGLIEEPGFRGRGLLGRFLYAIPPNRMGTRQITPPSLPDNIRDQYHQVVTSLLKIGYATSENGEESPHLLQLSRDAEAAINAFAARIEPQLRPFGAMGHMTDWGGKLVGEAARIAGILHMIEHAGEHVPWDTPVSKATLDAAIRLADYLIAHARAAYGEMEADPVIGGAQYLLDWIKRENRDSFTKREAHRGTQGRFKKVADLEPVLKLLIDHEYIQLRPQEKRLGPGQKPSPIFFVNPLNDRMDRIDRIPLSGEAMANSVNSVHSVTIDPENFSPPDEGDVEEVF